MGDSLAVMTPELLRMDFGLVVVGAQVPDDRCWVCPIKGIRNEFEFLLGLLFHFLELFLGEFGVALEALLRHPIKGDVGDQVDVVELAKLLVDDLGRLRKPAKILFVLLQHLQILRVEFAHLNQHQVEVVAHELHRRIHLGGDVLDAARIVADRLLELTLREERRLLQAELPGERVHPEHKVARVGVQTVEMPAEKDHLRGTGNAHRHGVLGQGRSHAEFACPTVDLAGE